MQAQAQTIPEGAINPYVFIVGCPRSGTTMLKRMLDAHASIAITRETHWITHLFKKRAGMTQEGIVLGDVVDRLCEHRRFSHLGLDRSAVEALIADGGDMTYPDLVSKIFDLYAAKDGKPLAGDKTPPYVRRIPLLHKLFPQAKFIHLVRDGRDAGLSLLNWRNAERAMGEQPTWTEDPVTTTALWWEWHIRLGREAGAELGDSLYYEMQYEKLVADPEGECLSMCEFLDLSYDTNMVHYEKRKPADVDAQGSTGSANARWLPPTRGLRDWRTQMMPEQLERFEAASGALFDELGYERGCETISASATEHAARMRSQFKGKRLPNSWGVTND